jgi:hypothetical protein
MLKPPTRYSSPYSIFAFSRTGDRFLKGFLLPQSITSFFQVLLIGLHLDAKEFSLRKHMVLRACTKVLPN